MLLELQQASPPQIDAALSRLQATNLIMRSSSGLEIYRI